MTSSAEQIVARLGLEPHAEGGFFRETYRATETVETSAGTRSLCTAILFLVTAARPSRFHRLTSDELWLYQGGDALEVAILQHCGRSSVSTLGPAGRGDPQLLVPAHSWQAAHVPATENEEGWTLVACVVSPGFDYADFELADRQALLDAWPDRRELVLALT